MSNLAARRAWSVFYVLMCLFCFAGSVCAETSSDSDLYYVAEDTFGEATFETRLSGGHDFSNPFLNVFSAGAGVFWLANSSMAMGLEFTGYGSRLRGSMQQLDIELARSGYQLSAKYPEHTMVGVLRITPLSGMLNLLSFHILRVDMHLLARGGTVKYRDHALGPLLGTGVEVHFGVTPAFGIQASVLWDAEKLSDQNWQWRNGFRAGPTLRF